MGIEMNPLAKGKTVLKANRNIQHQRMAFRIGHLGRSRALLTLQRELHLLEGANKRGDQERGRVRDIPRLLLD